MVSDRTLPSASFTHQRGVHTHRGLPYSYSFWHLPTPNANWQLCCVADPLDLLALFRSRSNTTTASSVAKDAKYWQLDWKLYFAAWVGRFLADTLWWKLRDWIFRFASECLWWCEAGAQSWCLIACRAYRGLYIINWIYRSFTEDNYRQWIGSFLNDHSASFCFMKQQDWCKSTINELAFPEICYVVQCGYLDLRRQACMRISFTTISKVGRIMRSSHCPNSHCVQPFTIVQPISIVWFSKVMHERVLTWLVST